MAAPQLSIHAQDIAQELAERENRTVTQIVERALEFYRKRSRAQEEPMAAFLERLRENAVDIDLEAIIKEGRDDRMREIDP